MDPGLLAVMAFFLLAIILIGGFALMMPLSRQVAKFLEYRMKDKVGISDEAQQELRRLRALVEGLDDRLTSVADRQEFLEKMLDSRDRDVPKLPH